MKLQIEKRISIVLSINDLDLREELAALLRRVTIEPNKQCWFVCKDWSHYAQYKGEPAHRWIFKVLRSQIIPGREICHKCDRKGCINPDHLFQGTHSDNMKDARSKGRMVHPYDGSRRPKLTRHQLLQSYSMRVNSKVSV